MTLPVAPHSDPAIEHFRRFNRFYTRYLGLLDEGLLQTGYSLSEARVLFELATRDNPGAREMSVELGLNPGYLSRILGSFEKSGLLERSPLPRDARHSVLRLTRKGKAAFAELNKRSAEQVSGILAALTPAKCTAMIRSMLTIESTLGKAPSSLNPWVLRPHRPGDMGWVIARHGALYAKEYGWDESFEALVAQIASGFILQFDSRRDRCWIAEREGEPLGSIFLVRHPEREDTAKLRLLLVEPSARGLGLGKALVDECHRFARTAGYKRVTLWTQSILHAAHRIYEQTGFRLVSEEPHHSFGKDLIGQTWDLEL